VPFEHGYLALHEGIKHRHRECSFPVSLAPNHAFVDELLSDGGNGRCPDAECCRNVSGLVRSWTELCHCTQILLLQRCQAIETDPEEVRVEMRNDVWLRLFDVDSVDGATGRGIPDLKSPLLKKLGIALRHAQHFRDGVVIKKNALVLGRVNQRIPCRCRLERPHLRIGEQTFGIRFSVAG
jgi:hypothetical protein